MYRIFCDIRIVPGAEIGRTLRAVANTKLCDAKWFGMRLRERCDPVQLPASVPGFDYLLCGRLFNTPHYSVKIEPDLIDDVIAGIQIWRRNLLVPACRAPLQTKGFGHLTKYACYVPKCFLVRVDVFGLSNWFPVLQIAPRIPSAIHLPSKTNDCVIKSSSYKIFRYCFEALIMQAGSHISQRCSCHSERNRKRNIWHVLSPCADRPTSRAFHVRPRIVRCEVNSDVNFLTPERYERSF